MNNETLREMLRDIDRKRQETGAQRGKIKINKPDDPEAASKWRTEHALLSILRNLEK